MGINHFFISGEERGKKGKQFLRFLWFLSIHFPGFGPDLFLCLPQNKAAVNSHAHIFLEHRNLWRRVGWGVVQQAEAGCHILILLWRSRDVDLTRASALIIANCLHIFGSVFCWYGTAFSSLDLFLFVFFFSSSPAVFTHRLLRTFYWAARRRKSATLQDLTRTTALTQTGPAGKLRRLCMSESC